MPRQRRIEYPGAIYHAMNRGDHREPIFQDDADNLVFGNVVPVPEPGTVSLLGIGLVVFAACAVKRRSES